MHQPSGIQKRLLSALRCIVNGDLEESFLHLSTAIDSTSKRHYPGVNQRKRYCDYLHKHQEEIFLISTFGSVIIRGGFGQPVTNEVVRIADAIYSVRCASVHDPEELDSTVLFVREGKFGFDNEGRFLINTGMLIALALLILSDPANQKCFDRVAWRRFGMLHHGKVSIDLHKYIGGRAQLLKLYRNLKKPRS